MDMAYGKQKNVAQEATLTSSVIRRAHCIYLFLKYYIETKNDVIYGSVLLMIVSENLTNPHFISLQTALKLESFRHSVSFS